MNRAIFIGVCEKLYPTSHIVNETVIHLGVSLHCVCSSLPLLLRMANAVEKIYGPTIYDVVDPSKTIWADFSRKVQKSFEKIRTSKQCLVVSLTAVIYNHITNANAWDSTVLNSILCMCLIQY